VHGGDLELRASYLLTTREILVARYLGGGLSNDAIARALVISPHTVRRHTESVLHKLGVGSRTEVRGRINRGSPPA
jgi:DNA-binding NarL/FixJ family response regulator